MSKNLLETMRATPWKVSAEELQAEFARYKKEVTGLRAERAEHLALIDQLAGIVSAVENVSISKEDLLDLLPRLWCAKKDCNAIRSRFCHTHLTESLS